MTELRWGYTLDDIHVIARTAAFENRFMASDHRDRVDTAWHAIVVELYTADRAPTGHDLATVARAAIWGMVRDHHHTYGYANRDWAAGYASAPKFVAYWMPPAADSLEDRVVERVTTGQVWAALSDRDRQVLAAFTACGDNRTAAAALGMPASSFSAYISAARRAWLALWHEGETPPRPRVVRPHSRYDGSDLMPCGTQGAAERHRRRKEPLDEACRVAAREYERARRARRKAVVS